MRKPFGASLDPLTIRQIRRFLLFDPEGQRKLGPDGITFGDIPHRI